MHVGVLAAIKVEGLPITGEFLGDSLVFLFPEPAPEDCEISVIGRSASGWRGTLAVDAAKGAKA